MSTANDLARMVPGFEFLQTLMKGASAGLPGVQGFGQWVAPTLDPEEIGKRIQELKTVQFLLEQNARLLGTTVQALEVQRMTLSTLQTMNLPLADLRNALQARAPAAAPAAAPSWPAPAAAAAPAEDEGDDDDDGAEAAAPAPAPQKKGEARKATEAPTAIDPMQWWGALTQQFAGIAAQAMKDSGADAARHLAGAVAPSSSAAAGAAPDKASGKAQKKTPRAPANTARPARTATPRKRPG
ncbi:MAG: hypothetical protein IPF94_03955 [Betaproteobacteria bacterium]|nr:hypothetical protein [Betaproteobacteria bacterium]